VPARGRTLASVPPENGEKLVASSLTPSRPEETGEVRREFLREPLDVNILERILPGASA
jgi:hypothetical protein